MIKVAVTVQPMPTLGHSWKALQYVPMVPVGSISRPFTSAPSESVATGYDASALRERVPARHIEPNTPARLNNTSASRKGFLTPTGDCYVLVSLEGAKGNQFVRVPNSTEPDLTLTVFDM